MIYSITMKLDLQMIFFQGSLHFNYYLIHKQECFFRYEKISRAKLEGFFISEKKKPAARVLNGLKYTFIFDSRFDQLSWTILS